MVKYLNILGKLYKANYVPSLYAIPLSISKNKKYVWGILFNIAFMEKSWDGKMKLMGMDTIFTNTQIFKVEKFDQDFLLSKDYDTIIKSIFKLKIEAPRRKS